ncbi:MAG: hypothetical protein K6G62_03665 [Eubacterium sp.]|nr:hypothetical protein [Eubacterium sp.]
MINSIDAMTMIPRTAEATTTQLRENNFTEHAAAQTGSQFEEKVEHDQQAAVETKESAREEMDREGDGKREGRDRRGQKKKGQEEGPMAPKSNSSFDIMI